MFRNRITTMQHIELWRDFLTRVMEGDRRLYLKEALGVVQEYFSRKVMSSE